MKDLQEATEKICEIKGECMALQVMFDALLRVLPPQALPGLLAEHSKAAEIARVTLLNKENVSDMVIASFDLHVQNMSSNLQSLQ
ncbi:hypothetical protein AWB64_02120 [Caballeronia sordidicola]|uniref:Uncharacterized protein n=1 Tax=Caballeronia sordidicola TaxID=196367 RepID=A0A158G3J1_CABSO|nr:hypothetical protein [Caballeronia sordidicola]SAL25980.1 hypothetical protein AWB64_02120 [Caballeronia sordidicola]